ncbi:hypothetical protein [Actinomycetospora cinnamomea]|uniref:Uncharacterized protein n=1 Tax=Actinomycetospora cinnamomea TaxID=663609 RepID=A0A2U1F7U2_9PSEU|nr:hypothetical protein [Actinomycetospora cinnamomea]PVZ08255.1 hypothetical protein C8D89_109140 [Actinomycetospora cinnamomea]
MSEPPSEPPSEQRREAADIEQRYVGEYNEEEALVEGLDPAQPREQKTTEEVAAVGDRVDEDVEEMADPDR